MQKVLQDKCFEEIQFVIKITLGLYCLLFLSFALVIKGVKFRWCLLNIKPVVLGL